MSSLSNNKSENLEIATVKWFTNQHKIKLNQRKQMVSDFNLKPNDKVLDAGCGPGLWTNLFAEKVFPNGEVIGLDKTKLMLDYGHNNLQDKFQKIIKFKQGFCEEIPYENDYFDFVFLSNMMLELPNPVKVLEELKRVTKPGGRIALKDYDTPSIITYPIDTYLYSKLITIVAGIFKENPSLGCYEYCSGRKLNGMLIKAELKNVSTTTYIIQKLPPLTEESKFYILGNLQWHIDVAQPYLSEKDLKQLEMYVDINSSQYIFDKPDFYFSMMEMIAIGIV